MSLLCQKFHYLLFRKCCSRYRFQPCDCAIPSSALWSRFSPPSNFINRHVSTMWFMGCHWPQSQEGDWVRPHLCKLAQHGPWPVRKWFTKDHVRQGRSKPGCRIVRSVTIVWLTTEADDQSSLHYVIVSTDDMSDHIGHWDASRGGGCSKTRANLDGLQWFEAYGQLPLYDVEKQVQHCWALAAMRAAWVAGSLKSGTLNYAVGCRWDLCSCLHWMEYSATE